MQINKNELGYAITNIRMSRGLAQRDLAKKANLKLISLVRAENGKSNLSIYSINKIANILKIPKEFMIFLASDYKSSKLKHFRELVRATKDVILAAAQQGINLKK